MTGLRLAIQRAAHRSLAAKFTAIMVISSSEDWIRTAITTMPAIFALDGSGQTVAPTLS